MSKALQRGLDLAVEHRADPPKELSLAEGGRRFFALGTGAFRKPTKHYQQRETDFKYLERILGDDFYFPRLLPATAEVVWRWFLDRSQSGENYRTAVRAVDTLYHIARWLHDRFPHEMPAVRAMAGWKTKLAEEWDEEFGPTGNRAKHLRHSPDDVERIFSNLKRADPRLALVLYIGAELRGGQVARTRRSQVDRSLGLGRWGLGRISVEGSKKKRGEIVDIDPEMEELLERTWGPEGHLQELEAAYRREEIDDYYLFQKGRMRQKQPGSKVMVIPLERHRTDAGPMDISTLIPIFHRFEKEIGIEPMPNRAFYGLRRVLTDIAPAYTDDERHLDRLTGHSGNGSTRVEVYQDRERPEDIAGAAEVRQEIRRDAMKGSIRTTRPRAGAPRPITLTDLARALQTLSAEEVEALLRWRERPAEDRENGPAAEEES